MKRKNNAMKRRTEKEISDLLIPFAVWFMVGYLFRLKGIIIILILYFVIWKFFPKH